MTLASGTPATLSPKSFGISLFNVLIAVRVCSRKEAGDDATKNSVVPSPRSDFVAGAVAVRTSDIEKILQELVWPWKPLCYTEISWVTLIVVVSALAWAAAETLWRGQMKTPDDHD